MVIARLSSATSRRRCHPAAWQEQIKYHQASSCLSNCAHVTWINPAKHIKKKSQLASCCAQGELQTELWGDLTHWRALLLRSSAVFSPLHIPLPGGERTLHVSPPLHSRCFPDHCQDTPPPKRPDFLPFKAAEIHYSGSGQCPNQPRWHCYQPCYQHMLHSPQSLPRRKQSQLCGLWALTSFPSLQVASPPGTSTQLEPAEGHEELPSCRSGSIQETHPLTAMPFQSSAET